MFNKNNVFLLLFNIFSHQAKPDFQVKKHPYWSA